MSSNSSPEGDEKTYQSDDSNFSDDFNSESDGATPEDLRKDYNRTKKYSHSKRNTKNSLLLVNTYNGPKSKRTTNGIIRVASKDSNSLLEKASTARRFKINDLQNEIKLLNQKIKELESENKLLKRTQRRQSIALKRYEGSEGELPILIRRHEEEVRSLRDQLRKMTEKYRSSDRTLRERTTEMERIRMQLQRLQSIVRDQNLEERSLLSKKLETLQAELNNKDKSVQETNHRLELTEKNYKHQLSIEFARHRETKKKLTELQALLEKMNIALKDKEREIDIRNIYSSRTARSPRPQSLTSGMLLSPNSQLHLKLDNEMKKKLPATKNNNLGLLNEEKMSDEVNNEISSSDSVRLSKMDEEMIGDKFQPKEFDENSFSFKPDLVHSQQKMDDKNSTEVLQGTVSKSSTFEENENRRSQGAIFETNYSTEFKMLPYKHQRSLPSLSDHNTSDINSMNGNNGERRYQFFESARSFSSDMQQFPLGQMMQSSSSNGGNGIASPHQNDLRNHSTLNSASDKDGESNESRTLPHKSRKFNLMQQLFGSVERKMSRTEDDGVTSHFIIRTSSSPNDNRSSSTSIKYKSPTDDFVDLFNNNISIASNVLSRHGRERNSLTPKQRNTGNLDEDATSVLF